jgi:ABC-2 type transport system permease protein
MVVLIAILIGAIMGYAATQDVDRLNEGSDLLGLLVLGFFMPVLALVYGGSMIRNELDDRSITPIITAPLDRRVSYLGYFISLILVLGPLVMALNLVGWSCFFLTAGVDDQAVGILLSYSFVIVIGGIVYSSLFLALGVVLKQPIYIGLFYIFIWEGFVGSLPGAIGSYTIGHQLRVLTASTLDYGIVAHTLGDVPASTIALLLVTVVMVVVGAVAFHRHEVP